MNNIRLNITAKNGHYRKVIKTENILERNISKSGPDTSSNDCNQCQYDSEDCEMDYVKTEDVENIEQFIDGKGVFTVKNEIDEFCGASKHINKDLKVDFYENNANSEESSDKHFLKRKDQVNRVWLKSFMKNLFESNNIDSEEVHLVDQGICVKEEIEMKSIAQQEKGTFKVKNEDEEITEQFIDENGVHDRGTYLVKSEHNTSDDLSQQVEEEASYDSKRNAAGVHDEATYVVKSERNNSEYLSEQIEEETKDIYETEISGFNNCVNNVQQMTTDNLKNDISDPNTHKCQLCEYASNEELLLKEHVDSVPSSSKPYKCRLCDYAANMKRELNTHINSVHMKRKEHECEFCDYVVNKKRDLKKHINRFHPNKKEYKCEYCEYASSERGHFKEHVDCVHLNLKKHKCHLCDYAANRKENLKRHIDSYHYNKKDYKCEFCEYATSRKANLDMHSIAVHLNLKRHKCSLCDYAANRKYLLKLHVDSVHLNLKHHKCKMCDYATNHKHALKAHVNSIHLKLKRNKNDLCGNCTSELEEK